MTTVAHYEVGGFFPGLDSKPVRPHLKSKNIGSVTAKGGHSMPRGKKEQAEQIIPKLRVLRGKTVADHGLEQ